MKMKILFLNGFRNCIASDDWSLIFVIRLRKSRHASDIGFWLMLRALADSRERWPVFMYCRYSSLGHDWAERWISILFW